MFSDLFDTVGNSHRGITNECGYHCFKERILNGLNFLFDRYCLLENYPRMFTRIVPDTREHHHRDCVGCVEEDRENVPAMFIKSE